MQHHLSFKQRLALTVNAVPKANAECFPYGKLRVLLRGNRNV